MNKLLTNILEESRFGPVDDMSAGSMIAMEKFMGRMIWRIRLVAIAFSAFSALAIPLPVALLWSATMWWVVLTISHWNAHNLAAAKSRNVRELLDEWSPGRPIRVWKHVSALVGGGVASLSSDAGEKMEFFHPVNLVGAVKAIERHIELFAPEFRGLRWVSFRASPEFFERWCEQTPEQIAELDAPIFRELDLEMRTMLARVRDQAASSGVRVFAVTARTS